MQCNQTQTLIPSYLDGELSETQAAPLRKHLLDCQPCRAAAQGGKALKRWFVDEQPPAIPAGFAARVARRAFAGDTGEPFATGATSAPAEAGRGERGRLLHFVLWTTAAAAGLLLTLSIGLRGLTLPDSTDLIADDGKSLSVDQALDQLDELNRAERRDAAAAERTDAENGADAR